MNSGADRSLQEKKTGLGKRKTTEAGMKRKNRGERETTGGLRKKKKKSRGTRRDLEEKENLCLRRALLGKII